ncbi:hypothetical protein FNV43_RR02702 [Rhamnella rubrinervis]|uniref:Uncharacterized protein n=1 Tax=Rhamnella rubrinervis TaxID=2594499 RepID=A0A8K0MNB7_9ROSA|nr:hypothetical protein FNV43_RR02702 [Rhamnella rubrinervis]
MASERRPTLSSMVIMPDQQEEEVTAVPRHIAGPSAAGSGAIDNDNRRGNSCSGWRREKRGSFPKKFKGVRIRRGILFHRRKPIRAKMVGGPLVENRNKDNRRKDPGDCCGTKKRNEPVRNYIQRFNDMKREPLANLAKGFEFRDLGRKQLDMQGGEGDVLCHQRRAWHARRTRGKAGPTPTISRANDPATKNYCHFHRSDIVGYCTHDDGALVVTALLYHGGYWTAGFEDIVFLTTRKRWESILGSPTNRALLVRYDGNESSERRIILPLRLKA